MINLLTYYVRLNLCVTLYLLSQLYFFREPRTYMHDDYMNMDIDAAHFTHGQRTAR